VCEELSETPRKKEKRDAIGRTDDITETFCVCRKNQEPAGVDFNVYQRLIPVDKRKEDW
jgi:hypothetical protein